MVYDKLVDSAQLDADLTIVADAIREKGGTTEKLPFPYGMKEAIENIDARGIPDGYDVYNVTPHYPTFACPAVPNGDYNNATNVDAAYLHNMVLSKGDAFYIKLQAYDKLDQSERIKFQGDTRTLPGVKTPETNMPGYYLELSIQSPVWQNLGYQYVDTDTMTASWRWRPGGTTTVGRLALRERISKCNVEIKKITYYKVVTSDGVARYNIYDITPKSRFINLPYYTNTDIADLRNLANVPSGVSFGADGIVVNSGDVIDLEVVLKPITYNGVDSLKATGEVEPELPIVEKTPKPDYDPVYYMDAGISGPGYWSNMGYQHANDELTYEFLWASPKAVQVNKITIRERINLLGTEVEVLDFKFYKKRPPIVSGELGTAILGEMTLGDEVN